MIKKRKLNHSHYIRMIILNISFNKEELTTLNVLMESP